MIEPKLTRRQRAVAELAARRPDLDVRGQARLTGLSPNAVQCMLSRIYKVLGIGRRAELASALERVR